MTNSNTLLDFIRGVLGRDKSVMTQFRYMIKIGAWFKASPLEWDDEVNEVRVAKPHSNTKSSFNLKQIMLKLQMPLLVAEAVFVLARIPAHFSEGAPPLNIVALTIHLIWVCEFLQTLNLVGFLNYHVEEFCSLANKTIHLMMRLEKEGGMRRGFLMQIYLLQNTVAPVFMPPVLTLVYLEFYKAPPFITGILGTQLDSWSGYCVLAANAALEFWLDLQYWACLCSWCQVLLIGLHTVKLTTNMARESETRSIEGCTSLYREMQAYMAALGSYYSSFTLPLTLTLLVIGMTFIVCGTIRFPGVISPQSYSIFPSVVVNLALVSYILHDTAGGALSAGEHLKAEFRRSQSKQVRKYGRGLPLRLHVERWYSIQAQSVITFFDFIIDRTVDIFLIVGFDL